MGGLSGTSCGFSGCELLGGGDSSNKGKQIAAFGCVLPGVGGREPGMGGGERGALDARTIEIVDACCGLHPCTSSIRH
jgi:hypothetical protein